MIARILYFLIVATSTLFFLALFLALFSGYLTFSIPAVLLVLSYLFLYFFLGAIILQRTRAKKFHPSLSSYRALQRTLSRWSFKLSLVSPEVYVTPLIGSNFFVIHMPLRRPCIVIGQALLDALSDDELEIIIKTAYVSIKTGESRSRYALTVITAPLFLPHLFALVLPKNVATYFVKIVNFYLFPFEMLRISIFKSAKSYERLDRYLLSIGLDQSLFNSLISNLSKRFHHPTLQRLTLTLVDNLFLFDPIEYETAMGNLLYGEEVYKRVTRLTLTVNGQRA